MPEYLKVGIAVVAIIFACKLGWRITMRWLYSRAQMKKAMSYRMTMKWLSSGIDVETMKDYAAHLTLCGKHDDARGVEKAIIEYQSPTPNRR